MGWEWRGACQWGSAGGAPSPNTLDPTPERHQASQSGFRHSPVTRPSTLDPPRRPSESESNLRVDPRLRRRVGPGPCPGGARASESA
eukprot:2750386-Rhodomonas_salina.2